MEKIEAFVKAGGKVIAIGNTPSHCYGLQGWKEKGARVREIVHRVPMKIAADEGEPLLAALRESQPADIQFDAADRDVGFIHRKTATHDYYFIANTSKTPKQLVATFRVGRRRPEILDPMSGEAHVAPHYSFEASGTKLKISLGTFGSTIVAFSKSEQAPKLAKVRRASAAPAPVPIEGSWLLEMNGVSVKMDKLQSWTNYEQFRAFSGTGVYRLEFQVSKPYDSPKLPLWISFGEVHEIADVELNGQALGVAWMTPYRLNVTGKLRSGRNVLVVKVTNLLINRVLGQPVPDTTELFKKYGHKMAQIVAKSDIKFMQNFEKDVIKEPLISGLLGPVEIVADAGEA
jgi:hypothetical protein